MTILALDLSSTNIGYAILNETGDLLDSGVIALSKFKKKSFPLEYIKIAYNSMSEIIQKNKPDKCIIEATFCRNVKTLKSLAMMRGVAMTSCLNNDLFDISEVFPSEARKKVLGNGSLTKEEVFEILKKKYGEKIYNKGYDLSDSILVGLTGIESNLRLL